MVYIEIQFIYSFGPIFRCIAYGIFSLTFRSRVQNRFAMNIRNKEVYTSIIGIDNRKMS